MAGNKGLYALMEGSAPEAICTHCMTHQSLATKELCPELSELMDTVTRTLSYIRLVH
jgi:hypothetical protein